MKDENLFIMLPNNLVWDYEKNKPLCRYYDDKIVYILSYLSFNKTLMGESCFSINDMITKVGMIPKTGKGKTIESFRNLLIQLNEDGIITLCSDNLSRAKDYNTCKLNNLIKQSNGNNVEFFTINVTNYRKIINHNEDGIDNVLLLKIFYYITSRIYKSKESDIFSKARCFFDSYVNICDQLQITENTYQKYIVALKEMELIFYDNIGLIKKGNNFTAIANNVYALDKENLKFGLKESKEYHLDNDYKLISDKVNGELKRINGLKGKIKSESNKGKDVSNLELIYDMKVDYYSKKSNRTN